MKLDIIISGKTANDVSFLKLFLIDYKKEFNVETVNPSCETCLKSYHNDFIKKYQKMENTSNYELHKKRENLILKFGSNIRVNNSNITDKYAKQLIENYKNNPNFTMDYLFSKYPKEETQTEQKVLRKKRK